MCQQLRQIYDKKSPIFLIEIITLITTLIINFSYPENIQCQDILHLNTLYWVIIIISASQIISKTLILTIVYCVSRQTANFLQILLNILFLVLHIAVWVYSILIFKNWINNGCPKEEPDYFYLNCFVVIYGVMILGSVGLIIAMLLPATVLTVFSLKNKDKQ